MVGTDVVECQRIKDLLDKWGHRFIKRVLTPAEWQHCRSKAHPWIHISGLVAAKEAVMKALGTGWGMGVYWKSIEITRDRRGKPEAILHGRAAECLLSLGARRVHISIAHTSSTAVATAVLEK
jgi:holo-[acyl-carrier protein] synthase